MEEAFKEEKAFKKGKGIQGGKRLWDEIFDQDKQDILEGTFLVETKKFRNFQENALDNTNASYCRQKNGKAFRDGKLNQKNFLHLNSKYVDHNLLSQKCFTPISI